MENDIYKELVKLRLLESFKYEHHYVMHEGILRQKSFIPYSGILNEINKARSILHRSGYAYLDGDLKKLA